MLLAAAAPSACTGGQSGTETPSPRREGDAGDTQITNLAPGPCACTLTPRSVLLRAELIELDDCRVRARAQEVLGISEALDLELEPGDELEARRVNGRGCGNGLVLAPGDPILFVYSPPDPALGQEGSALVATWGSEHVFGMDEDRTIALPEDERDRLLENAACSSWFKAQQGPDDVPPPDASVPACELPSSPR